MSGTEKAYDATRSVYRPMRYPVLRKGMLPLPDAAGSAGTAGASPISLRTLYAIYGTDTHPACDVRYPGTDIAYGISLSTRCAMPSTNTGTDNSTKTGISLRTCFAKSGTYPGPRRY
eukprot:2920693-Rhodomonas_salina.2